MKNYITKKFTSFTALSLLLAASLMPGLASAAGASISLTANKSTVPAGGSVIIAIYMNGGGTGINAVQADLSYPASKLQYVGFSANGSAFEIGAASGGGDGSATIARGSVSAVSGSGLVGTVTFKALAGSGSANIALAGSSSLVTDGNAVAYSGSAVNVNFGVAAATGGTPAVAPAAPVAPKDSAAPIISDVKVKEVTPFSTTITWTTNEASDSTVDYGLDANYGLSSSASPAMTAHSIRLNSNFLTPQTLFHYRVKSVDGAGNVATGTDKTVQLPGIMVTVIVRGAGGKPQVGASVTLDGATGTTNSKGSVSLPSSLGNKKIVTTYDGVTIQKPITVAKTAKPLPPYQLDLSKKPLNQWMFTSIGLAVVVLTLLAIDAVLFGSRVFARLARIHTRPHTLQPASQTASAVPLMTTAPATVTPPDSAVLSPDSDPSSDPIPAPAPDLEPISPADSGPSPADDNSDASVSTPEGSVVAIVDEMLAVPPASPIVSIDDIQLDTPPVPANPSTHQKIVVNDTPRPRPHSPKHHVRKAKTAPQLPK